ncbi:MAG: hypothetical protein KAW56_08005 [Candidatus Marinimicrobia bacterium]|nr:hypothetical protein [Candidatus Neomarinimicrobiota bacterium]
MKATIKLFKGLPIKTKQKESPTKELLEKTIKRGFVFSPEIIHNYSNYDELIKLVEEIFGITSEKVNASFHKSWKKVKETDIEQLIVEQVAHYLTTYGKEDPIAYLFQKEHLENWKVDNLSEKILGLEDFDSDKIYDKDYVYLPKEALDIPEIDIDEIKLIVIKGYTKQELKDKLLKLLNSGIALKEDTINDVTDVALFVDVNEKEIEATKNKEVRVILYDYLGLLPESPVEFLRYAVYVATDETLLIKSKELIEKIKGSKNIKITKIFKNYDLEKLAEIFYRFKPIFLAFRTNQKLKTIVNKIRKLAIHYHKPMPEDYLNMVTSTIKAGACLDGDKFEKELNKANTFRKIRLAYALKFRTKDVDSILYRIRNGKAYATDFHFEEKEEAKKTLNVVLDSIIKDISKNVKGKKIYIPDYINYSLPATEKQFTGNFPSGTYISIPQDMLVGIHWENVKNNSIDLDLSLLSPVEKYGWDSSYRDEHRSILFSGDITDASRPRGATELFYIRRQLKDGFIFMLNYYNYDSEIKVPFKIIVAREEVKDFRSNYMVNPNNIVTIVQSEISQKQKILGLLITTMNESRFYFAETSIGISVTSSNSEFAENSRKYLMNFYQNSIELKDILSKAGAKLVDDKDKRDIDLSPENLEKDSILNLLLKVKKIKKNLSKILE